MKIDKSNLSDIELRFVNLVWCHLLDWWELEYDRYDNGDLRIFFHRNPNWINKYKGGCWYLFPEKELKKQECDLYEYAYSVVQDLVVDTEVGLLEGRKSNIDYLIKRIQGGLQPKLTWLDIDLDKFSKIFDAQFLGLPTGGFCNPELVAEDEKNMEFWCYYDNFDNEEDGWTWYYHKTSGEFYN